MQRKTPQLLAIIFSFFVFFATTSDAFALQPGCAPEYSDIQENYAEAQVARTDAIMKEVIERPDSVNALSCFDQAMAASAKAGAIFSDTEPTFLPSFSSLIATGLGAAIGGPFGDGTTATLGSQIQSVVEPTLSNLLSGFTDALSAAFGSVLTSAFNTIMGPILSIPVLGGLLGSLLGITMDCTVSQDLWDQFVVGQGINTDVGNFSIEEFITNPGILGATGTVFQNVINANATRFNDVATDINNLNTPGFFGFNPTIPTIPPNATVNQIISMF